MVVPRGNPTASLAVVSSVLQEESGAHFLAGGSAGYLNYGDGRNTGKCFSAETERRYANKLRAFVDLASGESLEGDFDLIGLNSPPIIDDRDVPLAAIFDSNLNAVGTSVDGVFDELFHDRRGALDHLPSSDTRRESVGKNPDLWGWLVGGTQVTSVQAIEGYTDACAPRYWGGEKDGWLHSPASPNSRIASAALRSSRSAASVKKYGLTVMPPKAFTISE